MVGALAFFVRTRAWAIDIGANIIRMRADKMKGRRLVYNNNGQGQGRFMDSVYASCSPPWSPKQKQPSVG